MKASHRPARAVLGSRSSTTEGVGAAPQARFSPRARRSLVRRSRRRPATCRHQQNGHRGHHPRVTSKKEIAKVLRAPQAPAGAYRQQPGAPARYLADGHEVAQMDRRLMKLEDDQVEPNNRDARAAQDRRPRLRYCRAIYIEALKAQFGRVSPIQTTNCRVSPPEASLPGRLPRGPRREYEKRRRNGALAVIEFAAV